MTARPLATPREQPGSIRGDSALSVSRPMTSAHAWPLCSRRSVASWLRVLRSAPGAGQDIFVGGDLGGVIESREVLDAATPEGSPDQVIREVRVLGQQRAVQVRPQDSTLQATFGVVLAVVAEAHAHVPQGFGLRPEERTAAVVLETDQGRGRDVGEIGVDDDIADESALASLGADVDQADAGESLAVAGLVVVAEELVAAADGEDPCAGGDRTLEGRLLMLDEVFVHERLLAVLPAAEEEDVDLVHTLGRAATELDEARLVVAPFGALEKGEDVAPIAVDVHEVGVQPANGEGFLVTCHVRVCLRSPSRAWPSHV